jgi:predicted phage baseplate assembly protein
VARILSLETDTDLDHTRVVLEKPLTTAVDVSEIAVFALRDQAAFFGHNAPRYGSLPADEFAKDDPFASTDPAANWDVGRTVWSNSRGEAYSDGAPDGPAAVFLERRIDELVPGGWTVFVGTTLGTAPQPAAEVFRVAAVSEASLADYALAGEVTGLALEGLAAAAAGRTPFDVRRTTAYVVSEALAFAEQPITDPFPSPTRSGDAAGARLILDGEVEGLRGGQALTLTAERADGSGEERRVVLLRTVDSESVPGHTTLVLEQAILDPLVRSSLRLNANVARATHGETVEEVLGSGDAAQTGQSFRLQRSPLTFDSAPVPGGTASSLTVRVDGVRWQEVASLHGQGSEAQVYTVEVDEEGRATVRFGDGIDGARLPSGAENVTAVYRFGLGPDGEVAAGSLSLLATRPLGIAEVTNPLAAAGAAAPDTVEQARRNAPVTVRTLGRVVSLSDFEDFTLAFAGIGRVRAAPLGGVHLTVAGVGGTAVDPGSVLFENLFEALETARLPGPPMHLASYEPLPFDVAAKLVIDPRFRAEDVFGRAREALAAAYAFERRQMAQPLWAADVVTLLQAVSGVVAVDLDALHLTGAVPRLPARLDALPARRRGAEILPAQLLLLNPDGITLGVRTP